MLTYAISYIHIHVKNTIPKNKMHVLMKFRHYGARGNMCTLSILYCGTFKLNHINVQFSLKLHIEESFDLVTNSLDELQHLKTYNSSKLWEFPTTLILA